MSALLDHLVASRPSRSGLMSLNVTPPRPDDDATFGVETVWQNRFTEAQIKTAPPSLQVLIRSQSVWLVPGSSEELNKLLRSRGFAVDSYTLNDEEKNWIVAMLPADKAAKWSASSHTCTFVMCSGTVKESTGLVAWASGDIVGTCDLGEGLKIQEVAPVKGGSLFSDLSSAVGNTLRAAYEWVAPGSVKNATLVSATREPTPEEKQKAGEFLRSYDEMAASVQHVEGLVKQGAVLRREQEVQLRISRVFLAQYAQPAAEMRRALGRPGSPNRATLRQRVKTTYRSQDAFGVLGVDDLIVIGVLVVLSLSAALIVASVAAMVMSVQATRQKELDAQVMQDLAARCADSTLAPGLRETFCNALENKSKQEEKGIWSVNWEKVAMWGGVGLLGVAGAVVISKGLGAAQPAIQLATKRAQVRFVRGQGSSRGFLQASPEDG